MVEHRTYDNFDIKDYCLMKDYHSHNLIGNINYKFNFLYIHLRISSHI